MYVRRHWAQGTIATVVCRSYISFRPESHSQNHRGHNLVASWPPYSRSHAMPRRMVVELGCNRACRAAPGSISHHAAVSPRGQAQPAHALCEVSRREAVRQYETCIVAWFAVSRHSSTLEVERSLDAVWVVGLAPRSAPYWAGSRISSASRTSGADLDVDPDVDADVDAYVHVEVDVDADEHVM